MFLIAFSYRTLDIIIIITKAEQYFNFLGYLLPINIDKQCFFFKLNNVEWEIEKERIGNKRNWLNVVHKTVKQKNVSSRKRNMQGVKTH